MCDKNIIRDNNILLSYVKSDVTIKIKILQKKEEICFLTL